MRQASFDTINPDKQYSNGNSIGNDYRKNNTWVDLIQPLEKHLCDMFSLDFCKIMSVNKFWHFISFAQDKNMAKEKLALICNKLSDLGINSQLSAGFKLVISDELNIVQSLISRDVYKEQDHSVSLKF